MKTVICNLFLIITILQVLEAFRVFYFNKEEKDCIKQLDADEDKIENLYLRYTTPENDTQFNHFMECLWKKLEFLTEDGNINYEKMKNSPQVLRKTQEDNIAILIKIYKLTFDAVSKCESKHTLLKADTAGETAVKVQNCILSNFQEATKHM
ncbi:hypothetical protein ILUMI_11464 [Ignelater luminosus]|uniref:Uncharacterized protein n=1 Tax=Ignelater luminosus TaxID=2038154 RepID=A0A8K0GCP3_IGNLU|nr:hypothetical protein ILUMI_11464 [Ignelater luminosus]